MSVSVTTDEETTASCASLTVPVSDAFCAKASVVRSAARHAILSRLSMTPPVRLIRIKGNAVKEPGSGEELRVRRMRLGVLPQRNRGGFVRRVEFRITYQ